MMAATNIFTFNLSSIPNDYQVSKQHNLPFITIFDDDGIIIGDMAKTATEAVESGELKTNLDTYEKTCKHWMNGIRDYAPIPFSDESKTPKNLSEDAFWVVGRILDEELEKAANKFAKSELTSIILLDTWFSSGLFPFSIFGWLENTDQLKAFYPTTLLGIENDIIFFWVVRILGLKLIGKVQLKEVFLYGMVCDAHIKIARKCNRSNERDHDDQFSAGQKKDYPT